LTMKLKCPVCGEHGTLMSKTTITKTSKATYRYLKWYVYHNKSKGTKQRWCYLSKKYLQLPEIKEAISKQLATQNKSITTQNTTQTSTNANRFESSLIQQKKPINQSLSASQADIHQQCMLIRIC